MQITQSSLLRELQKKLYWYIKFFNLFGQESFFFYFIEHSCILDIGKNWRTSICAGRGINWNNHWRQCALYFGFNLLNHQVAFLAGEVGKEMSSPDFFVQHQFWKLITCSSHDLKKEVRQRPSSYGSWMLWGWEKYVSTQQRWNVHPPNSWIWRSSSGDGCSFSNWHINP